MASENVKPKIYRYSSVAGCGCNTCKFPWQVQYSGKIKQGFSEWFLAVLFAVKVFASPNLMQDEG